MSGRRRNAHLRNDGIARHCGRSRHSCQQQDKAYEFFGSADNNGTTVDSDITGFISISTEIVGVTDVHTVTINPLPSTQGQGTAVNLFYTIEIDQDACDLPGEGECLFKFIDLGSTKGSGNDDTTVTKTVWRDNFFGSQIVELESVNGTDPESFLCNECSKLWIKDSVLLSGADAQLNSLTNGYTEQRSVPVPGTLALMALGLFGLRRRLQMR